MTRKIKWVVKLAPVFIDPAFVSEEDEITCFVYADNCDEAADRAIIGPNTELYITRCYPA